MHAPKEYCAITTRSPFAAVLVRRHFTGAIIVGGAWQNDRSLQAVLDDLKARLKKEFSQHWLNAGIVARVEDSEAGRALAEMAERTVPIGWNVANQAMEVLPRTWKRRFASRARSPRNCRLTRMDRGRMSSRRHWMARSRGDATMRLPFASGRPERMRSAAARNQGDLKLAIAPMPSSEKIKVISNYDK
jgi:hypothetical protein